MAKPNCVIIGVGPGNGTAFAKKFNAEGYAVALLARKEDYIQKLAEELEDAKAYLCDITIEADVKAVFEEIQKQRGPVDVLIHNAGGGHFKNIDETTVAFFEEDWRVNALGCLMAAKQVIPGMRASAHGTIVIIGATASWTGNAGFVPFAAAKSAQRSLAQSMARYLGPQGIHVCYVIIDGVINLPRTRRAMPDKPDDFFINPDHIAESVFYLTQQKPSAWTFELDLRPFGENW
jgi:NAD(P)-dependent dehydrogenase (short-subunit alcohol dehydrogenase family)